MLTIRSSRFKGPVDELELSPFITDAWTEQDLTSVELPQAPFIVNEQEAEELHYSVISRIVVTAARAGDLIFLCLPATVQQPFAVRALLPAWVEVEGWALHSNQLEPSYHEAAAGLRCALIHASRWYHEFK